MHWVKINSHIRVPSIRPASLIKRTALPSEWKHLGALFHPRPPFSSLRARRAKWGAQRRPRRSAFKWTPSFPRLTVKTNSGVNTSRVGAMDDQLGQCEGNNERKDRSDAPPLLPTTRKILPPPSSSCASLSRRGFLFSVASVSSCFTDGAPEDFHVAESVAVQNPWPPGRQNNGFFVSNPPRFLQTAFKKTPSSRRLILLSSFLFSISDVVRSLLSRRGSRCV